MALSAPPHLSPYPAILFNRQGGLLSGPAFASLLTKRRLYTLQLSDLRSVDATFHSAPINDLSLDPTDRGRFVLAAASNGTIYIHDLVNPQNGNSPKTNARLVAHIGRSSRHSHVGSVDCIQWLPTDSGIFVSGGHDKTVKFWDANELFPADTYPMEGRVNCINMSALASHQLVAVATTINHVRLIDPKSGSDTHELRGHEAGGVITCKWSNRRENILATGGADGKVILWDIRRSKSLLTIMDCDNVKRSRKRKINEMQNKDKKVVSHKGPISGLSFAPDGLSLFSLGKDAVLRRWCTNTGRNMKAKFPPIYFRKRIRVPFEAFENLICMPHEDSKLYLLDTVSYEKVGELSGHYDGVNCCAYNETDNSIVSGGSDRNILVWESHGEVVEAYERHLREVENSSNNPAKQTKLQTHNVLINGDNWSDDSDNE